MIWLFGIAVVFATVLLYRRSQIKSRHFTQQQYGYAPKNVFTDTSINNIIQEVFEEIDQVE